VYPGDTESDAQSQSVGGVVAHEIDDDRGHACAGARTPAWSSARMTSMPPQLTLEWSLSMKSLPAPNRHRAERLIYLRDQGLAPDLASSCRFPSGAEATNSRQAEAWSTSWAKAISHCGVSNITTLTRGPVQRTRDPPREFCRPTVIVSHRDGHGEAGTGTAKIAARRVSTSAA
jgi:hypothetical protein